MRDVEDAVPYNLNARFCQKQGTAGARPAERGLAKRRKSLLVYEKGGNMFVSAL